jgi:hypothetical protein
MQNLLKPSLVFFFCLGVSPLRAQSADVAGIVPPGFFNIPVVPKSESFPTEFEQSQCENGARIGKALAKNFITRIDPTCADLILKFKNEWAVPEVKRKNEKPLNICFTKAYAHTFQKVVLQTSLLCAGQLEQGFLQAQQDEYDRCYKETADAVLRASGSGALVFAEADTRPLGREPSEADDIMGEYVLVPRDSARWMEFLDEMSFVSAPDDTIARTGAMIQACNLGIADVQTRHPPRQFID